MTLTEVSNGLENERNIAEINNRPYEVKIISIAIEAVKREIYHRICNPNQSPNYYPGETEK